MSTIHRKSEQSKGWYAVPVDDMEKLLIKVITTGHGFPHPYALRKNLCYNLQYLEYVHATIDQIKMSNVILTQSWKIFIVTGCGVVESILKFLLIKHGLHKKTDWQLEKVFPGAEKTHDGKRKRIDSHIYTKSPNPIPSQMNFDGMIRKAKAKKVLGSNSYIYDGLDNLRALRNRVHLQRIDHATDTDWNAFHKEDFETMKQVLYDVLTSNIFRPSRNEIEYFEYLRR